MTDSTIDIGHGHRMRFVGWSPDRTIPGNAELFRDIPDDPRASLLVTHDCPAHGPAYEQVIGLNPAIHTHPWRVESWEPLTIAPSLLFTCCGDHGFIRDGRWIPA